jgi:organic radical activating enzyme
MKNFIKYGEFYITNVCNLTCAGCNRFNNFNFRGYQKWKDYKHIYKEWANEIKFQHMAILGGEPLLNPDFMDWAEGIRSFWPGAVMRIVSNGFQIPKIKNFYKFLHTNKFNTLLLIGIHNKKHKKQIFNIVDDFLEKPLQYIFNNDNKYQQFVEVIDKNGVKIKIEYNWWFHQGSIIRDPITNTLSVHDSDPIKSHANCSMKECHTFIRGKLYKCALAALFPEFHTQYKFTLTDKDLNIMQSYRPLSVTDSAITKTKFLNELSNPIPQCKFCPEVYNGEQIFSIEKKDQ